MAIRHGDRHKAYLGPPLCSQRQRQEAYNFITRNNAAGRLRPIGGWGADLVAGYASILGLEQEHQLATYPVVIRRPDGTEIEARFEKVSS